MKPRNKNSLYLCISGRNKIHENCKLIFASNNFILYHFHVSSRIFSFVTHTNRHKPKTAQSESIEFMWNWIVYKQNKCMKSYFWLKPLIRSLGKAVWCNKQLNVLNKILICLFVSFSIQAKNFAEPWLSISQTLVFTSAKS